METNQITERLEYLREQITKECISYGEIAELQSLIPHIDKNDVLLLEWAGVPEQKDEAYTKDELIAQIMAVYKNDDRDTLLERLQAMLYSRSYEDVATEWTEMI